MTDNEIIKALKCCTSEITREVNCTTCPMLGTRDCMTELKKNALDLINRQKAEIERLRNNVFCKIVIDDEKMDRIKNDVLQEIKLDAESIRSESVKEFAEMLKGYLLLHKLGEMSVVSFEDIDDLVKRMIEGEQ